MDRHVRWLRGRIMWSVSSQAAKTFAVAAIVAFVLLSWRFNASVLTAVFGSVVIGQVVAVARIGHAMRWNPRNIVAMERYLGRPFSSSVARFQGHDDAHPVAQDLPGFTPVATVRTTNADPEAIYDIYVDPTQTVAALVTRDSGSVALVSSLRDTRIIATQTRLRPPHEGLVMNLASDDDVHSILSAHHEAIEARDDVSELASSAHQVAIDLLALEYSSYAALGPALSPFLQLDPSRSRRLRLMARIDADELTALPAFLGSDVAVAQVAVAAPPEAQPSPPAQDEPAAELTESQRRTKQIDAALLDAVQHHARPSEPDDAHLDAAQPETAPLVAAPEMAVPDIVTPDVATPVVAAPAVLELDVSAPRSPAPQMPHAIPNQDGPLDEEGAPPAVEPVILTPVQQQQSAPNTPLDLSGVLAEMASTTPPGARPKPSPTPPVSLAEAMPIAPTTAAELSAIDFDLDLLVPTLQEALGRIEEQESRPRLSAALRGSSGTSGPVTIQERRGLS